jgi:hypothetical protein
VGPRSRKDWRMYYFLVQLTVRGVISGGKDDCWSGLGWYTAESQNVMKYG